MIERQTHLRTVTGLLSRFPVVGLLGARQVGKTTLAAALAGTFKGEVAHFDLEDPAAVARLADPMLALRGLQGLVVLDEIQHRPDLFASLRVLADRQPVRARFLVLGSASPQLLRQSAESLAGRIAYHFLPGLGLAEVPAKNRSRLWLRGGFPQAFLARSEAASFMFAIPACCMPCWMCATRDSSNVTPRSVRRGRVSSSTRSSRRSKLPRMSATTGAPMQVRSWIC